MKTNKLKQQKGTLLRVLQYVKPYRVLVIISLLCACVSAAAQLLIPILTGKAIDQMIGAGQVNLSGVLVFAVWIAVVAALSAVAQQFLATSNNKIAYNISRDLRNAAFHKLQRLPLSYLDAHPSGDLVSRMIADVDTFSDGLLMGFTQLFTGVVLIVGTLTIMLIKNWMIALLVVVLTPLSMFVASFIARKTHHYFTEQARVRGQQTALINELIEGQKVVQSFGHEAASLSDFDCINDELGRVSLNATFFSSLTNPSTRLVNNIIYAAVALVGALSAVGGGISVGEDGASHQCCEDFALMRSIPGMVVICPADGVEAEAAVKAAYEYQGPVYLRMGRLAVPVFHEDGFAFKIGKGEIMREGTDIAIIANGLMTYEAIKAGEALEAMGIRARIVNMSTIKPLDEELVIKAAKETGAIVTAENHNVTCGLGSVVSNCLAKNCPTVQEFVGVQDLFGQVGPQDFLMDEYGLRAANIVAAVKKAISRK